VEKVRCEVDRETYHAAPNAGYVRLYFLPRSHTVVNLERLPDRPLPQDAMVPGLMRGALGAWLRRATTTEAETIAAMSTLKTIADAEYDSHVATPSSARDPRPLQEVILGEWRTTLMSLTFALDGTVTTALPDGRQATGRWSVTSDGRLHADVMGRSRDTEAWVEGDDLTLRIGKQGMVLHRKVD
jgi:hypothetical protein